MLGLFFFELVLVFFEGNNTYFATFKVVLGGITIYIFFDLDVVLVEVGVVFIEVRGFFFESVLEVDEGRFGAIVRLYKLV